MLRLPALLDHVVSGHGRASLEDEGSTIPEGSRCRWRCSHGLVETIGLEA